jgi:integrase
MERGLCKHDPAAPFKRAGRFLRKSKKLPALSDDIKMVGVEVVEERLSKLLQKLRAFRDNPKTPRGQRLAAYSVELMALTFPRPQNVYTLQLDRIDWKKRTWTLAPEEMKEGELHKIPLSRQAFELLDGLRQRFPKRQYAFQLCGRKPKIGRMNEVLRAIGYDTENEQCGHGFRSIASTLLRQWADEDEKAPRWSEAAIEGQLAHLGSDQVRATYDKSDVIKERTRMMQYWADRLDELRNRGNVVPMRRKAA